MSGIHLVPGNEGLESEFITFPDLVEYLKSNFENIRDLSDLDSFMELLSTYLKSDELSSEQKRSLKALRQKGYDKKSKLKRPGEFVQPPVPHAEAVQFDEVNNSPSSQASDTRTQATYQINKTRLWQLFPARNVKIIFLFFSAAVVGYLLWLQSISLYKSSGFENPALVAFTGIIMVIGFSIYHAHSRSWLALICCIYIGFYETYFIASGTFSDEVIAKTSSPQILEQKKWYFESVDRAKADYDDLKERYEDPGDRIFQNAWFKKKHLDPAWETYSEAQKEFVEFNRELHESSGKIDHVGWLKVLFRLGLVGLFMLVIHQVVSIRILFHKD